MNIVVGSDSHLPDGSGTVFPLSFPQQRPWFLNELNPGTAAYNIPIGVRLRGVLDVRAMGDALGDLIFRHEILRTVYRTEAGGPVQVICDPEPMQLDPVNVESEMAALAAFDVEARRGFDLSAGPILRSKLFKITAEDHLLVLGLHHIACDAWSLGIMARELGMLYNARRARQSVELETPALQYVDFAEWQRDEAGGSRVAEAGVYWIDRLSSAPPLLKLYTDRSRPAVQSYSGAHINVDLPPSIVAAIDHFATETNATPYAVLLSAFAILLSRWSDGARPVVGSAVANRDQEELAEMIGFFTNTLVFYPELGDAPDFRTLVQRVGAEVRMGLAHQQLPFEILVEKLSPDRDPSYSPLFQVMFILWEASDDAVWQFDDLSAEQIHGDSATSKFDLSLSLYRHGDHLTARFEYATALFDRGTIERFAAQFAVLLGHAIAAPQTAVTDIPVLGDLETTLLDASGDGGPCPVDNDDLCSRFAKQIKERSNTVALVDEKLELTFAELAARSDSLAMRLVRLGVGPGSVVGVHIDRSAMTVVAMLAILKSGAAYLPLDPAYPEERLRFIIEDSGTNLVVCDASTAASGSALGVTVVPVDPQRASPAQAESFRPPEVGSEDLAYVIYTSGSTGKPKGVEITRGNLEAFLAAMDLRIGQKEPGVWLAVTSISFDISVLELLWTLSRGFQVIMKADETTEVGLQTEDVERSRVLDLSLHFFGNAESADAQMASAYDFVLDMARFADQNGFAAVWTPERHFHSFGGLYPNPAVLGAAIAAVTNRISIRAGSVVLPLHDALEVAEQWTLLDNLSNGRSGISVASGWAPNDFVLAPEIYKDRKASMLQKLDELCSLWRGDAVTRVNGAGSEIAVRVFPRPVQAELPFWITSARHAETFEMAGRMGGGVLTHMVGQTLDELADKISIYRTARREAGHSGDGHVCLMLHTYLHEDPDVARETVRVPLTEYIKTSFDLMKGLGGALNTNMEDLRADEVEQVAQHAFERFFDSCGLFGTPDMAVTQMARLSNIGIDEIGCLIDFGIDKSLARQSLSLVARTMEIRRNKQPKAKVDHRDVAALIERFNVTHMQCTPTTASVLADDARSLDALAQLDVLLVGGEALSETLASRLAAKVKGQVHNMYGPTEATVWATSQHIDRSAPIRIGRPLPGYRVCVLGADGTRSPIGIPGELLIGGPAVARGYLGRPDLTAERFVTLAAHPGRFYRTGDLVRFCADGSLEFLGRNDSQIKLRGRRIELGEIEAALNSLDVVRDAAVVLRGEGEASAIYGYVTLASATAAVSANHISQVISTILPQHMVPTNIFVLDQIPKTPNGKIDRRALPDPNALQPSKDEDASPENTLEIIIADIWKELLGREAIGRTDNFFQIGGNSILVVRVRNRLNDILGRHIPLVDLFRHVTIEKLAVALGEISTGTDETPAECEAVGDRKRAARSRLAQARKNEKLA